MSGKDGFSNLWSETHEEKKEQSHMTGYDKAMSPYVFKSTASQGRRLQEREDRPSPEDIRAWQQIDWAKKANQKKK